MVAKGERPTVERIRAHLGTGSPNTVTRWLETWWNRLGTRLQRARPDLEGAPVVLAELAGQWWELALKHAQEAAHRELAEAEQVLAAQRDALEAKSRLVDDELTQMRSERDAALTGERTATTQASELQHLVDQLQLQISELAEQRDLERRRADRTETARQQLDARLHDALETAKSEREDWTEYVRSVENRALSDVDRARQEAKELQAQQSKASEQHRALEKQLRPKQ
ncbi:DNA-binding protein [Stenotrophomonas maltophilia]|nr:DNA-binding protein [Stenotrophomonas maltophilia]